MTNTHQTLEEGIDKILEGFMTDNPQGTISMVWSSRELKAEAKQAILALITKETAAAEKTGWNNATLHISTLHLTLSAKEFWENMRNTRAELTDVNDLAKLNQGTKYGVTNPPRPAPTQSADKQRDSLGK